jgi:hypothetical protein
MLAVIPRRPTVVNLMEMVGINLRKNVSLLSGSSMPGFELEFSPGPRKTDTHTRVSSASSAAHLFL